MRCCAYRFATKPWTTKKVTRNLHMATDSVRSLHLECEGWTNDTTPTYVRSTHGIHLAKRGMVTMGIPIGHHFKHKDPKLARNGFICTTVPISIGWSAFPMKIATTGGIPGVQTHFFRLPQPQLLGFSLVSCIQHRKAPAKKMHFWRRCAVHDRKCTNVIQM